MIIKILDNENKPICMYADGRWIGRVHPKILSEAVEIIFFMLKSARGEKLFRRVIEDWPVTAPESPQNHFDDSGVSSHPE